jgi:hypothetical protein
MGQTKVLLLEAVRLLKTIFIVELKTAFDA